MVHALERHDPLRVTGVAESLTVSVHFRKLLNDSIHVCKVGRFVGPERLQHRADIVPKFVDLVAVHALAREVEQILEEQGGFPSGCSST